MSTAIVTLPHVMVELTVDQLILAAAQLEPQEKARLARALADNQLDTDLVQLISDLYDSPPVEEISDEVILEEIRAVRLGH